MTTRRAGSGLAIANVRAPEPRDAERLPAHPGWVTIYALAVLAVALGAAASLLVSGAELPPLGACLALALPLTLCMNRFVFFPNEVGATAEAAVLFTAIVAFRSESPMLGPVVLALLVGALDARHWERRAFLRMSYNSGSQALTVLATAAVFVPLTAMTGTTSAGLLLASVLAALPYVALETGFGVVLVVLLGEPTRVAVRQHLPTNALAVPLAMFGAVVALAVAATSSWLLAFLLVPTAWIPELVLVGVRRARWRLDLIGAGVLAGFGIVVVVLDPVASGTRVSGAIGIATLALVLAADVQPLRPRGLLTCAALVLATAAGLASTPWLVLLCSAAWVLPLVVATRPVDAVWSLPLVFTATMLAGVVRSAAALLGVLIVVGVAAIVGAVATWGSLPWPSRLIGPWGAQRSRWFPIAVLATLSAACIVAAVWCLFATAPLAGQLSLVAAGGALACSAASVRQWRFARGTRRRDGAWLAVGALALAASLAGEAGEAGDAVVIGASFTTLLIAVVVALRCERSVRCAQVQVEAHQLR